MKKERDFCSLVEILDVEDVMLTFKVGKKFFEKNFPMLVKNVKSTTKDSIKKENGADEAGVTLFNSSIDVNLYQLTKDLIRGNFHLTHLEIIYLQKDKGHYKMFFFFKKNKKGSNEEMFLNRIIFYLTKNFIWIAQGYSNPSSKNDDRRLAFQACGKKDLFIDEKTPAKESGRNVEAQWVLRITNDLKFLPIMTQKGEEIAGIAA
ncbi:MAG: hypothetical protein KAR54_00665 [Candidatus Pacebacteria bacterium]|nr:hypothetical protein [Candidatus Paceibacterota bacterium]